MGNCKLKIDRFTYRLISIFDLKTYKYILSAENDRTNDRIEQLGFEIVAIKFNCEIKYAMTSIVICSLITSIIA